MQAISVLVIHNRYRQPGGEDAVVRSEIELLRTAGHRVIEYTRDNNEIERYSPLRKSALFFRTTWAGKSYSELRKLVRIERPEIAHCHNLLPLVSPAAYYACRAAGVPVVQTLHNYRLICPAGTLFHGGRSCDKCLKKPGDSIWRGCYRNSPVQTGAVSLMLATHRRLGTWKRLVDAYITPSFFCRDYFIRAGLPERKIQVKPNFLVRDPGGRTDHGHYALSLGRLSAEKGVLEMIQAWKALREIPLFIGGDGPLAGEAQRMTTGMKAHIKLLGHLDNTKILRYMKGARFLVFPSRWFEPFGMTLLEAAACGVPAIASRIGGIPEVVVHGRTGLLFDPANFEELSDCVRWAWTHPREMDKMGDSARQLYLEKFAAEKNYSRLMNIYQSVLASAQAKGGGQA